MLLLCWWLISGEGCQLALVPSSFMWLTLLDDALVVVSEWLTLCGGYRNSIHPSNQPCTQRASLLGPQITTMSEVKSGIRIKPKKIGSDKPN